MPPFTAAACPWSNEGDDGVSSEEKETRLQQAQLADWLMQGNAYSAKSSDITEEAVVLKVLSGAQPDHELISDLLHPAAS